MALSKENFTPQVYESPEQKQIDDKTLTKLKKPLEFLHEIS